MKANLEKAKRLLKPRTFEKKDRDLHKLFSKNSA
jgi:hypothetical protein